MATSAVERAALGGQVTQSLEAGKGNTYLHLCLAPVLPSSLLLASPLAEPNHQAETGGDSAGTEQGGDGQGAPLWSRPDH